MDAHLKKMERMDKALKAIVDELRMKYDKNARGYIANSALNIETTAPQSVIDKLVRKHLIEKYSLEVGYGQNQNK